MSDLKTNLESILEEKQSKIKPENIKKDVQIFDITGTYEGNSGDVKLFETEEEMQADITAQEGDLAVVYRNEIQNMTANTQTQFITFPETVILTEAFTDSAYAMIRAVDSSIMFDGSIMLDQYSFRFDGYSETGMIRVLYNSDDGITYTRTQFTGDSGDLINPVDLGTTIQCYNIEEWNNTFGYFMYVGGKVFEGLYEYSKVSSSDVFGISNIQYGTTITYDNEIRMYANDIASAKQRLMTYVTDNLSELSFSGALVCYSKDKYYMYCFVELEGTAFTDNALLAPAIVISSGVSYLTPNVGLSKDLTNSVFNIYEFEITQSGISHNVYTDFVTWNDGSYSKPRLSQTILPQNYVLCGINSINTTLSSFSIGLDDSEHKTSELASVQTAYDNLYILAPNQLSTTKDLVYNSIYYGKDGANEGILTTNVSNSFADINAEVYYKIQQVYDNMEPRILTDDDKTIDKSIYFIPIKPDGTPLLDTSQVTNMNNMFQSCTNLQTIPKLDTNNVTNMMAMLQNCFGLTAISQLDISQVTNTSHMFQNCTSLTTIPLLDTSQVTNMQFMFDGCTNLTTVPELDTSQATNMSYMFSNCTNLQTIPELDTSQATNMNYMFKGSFNLITIPLLDTSQATTIAGMFQDCTNLQAIPELNTSKVYDINFMFSDCTNLTTVPLLDLSHISFMSRMFRNCSSLSEESLNNILAMCLNVQFLHSSNKTLQYIGLSEEQATKCTTLSNYQAFTEAGWTTGY